MGNFRPLPTKCWELFLTSKGFKYSRTSASHHVWTKTGVLRSIIFQGANKEIPALHLKTCCNTIGCKIDELMKWADVNC